MMPNSPSGGVEPIAIIGIGCRFPGADGPRALWRLLADGIDAVSELPAGRFDVDALHDPGPGRSGLLSSRRGGFLEGLDAFDAEFFGISPREADRMDPQQRLLLEAAWEAMEDAGQVPERLAGSDAGVFIGMWTNDYQDRMFADLSTVDFYMTTGAGRYSASGRLSYLFGFHGPGVTVDAACSSSLVAVHLACQSLWSGECSLALAGGANTILEPPISIAYSQSGMLSPDGRCKFGDARANGYVRSEGVGVVVLKRLTQAQADADRIYAVVLGSAVNNDGRSSGFLATPAREGQIDVMRKALRKAGISPGRVHYVEAHGTGTSTGDPVEIEALGAVLAVDRPPARPCVIGSVKTNIGHTEAAAGVAGLIKVALCLKHRAIPPSLHFREPNPEIPWGRLPLVVPTELTPWPASEPAVAGVSSFGIAGTNAHVVLEEAPPVPSRDHLEEPGRPRALPLSARSPAALEALARAYRDFLAGAESGEEEVVSLDDVCYTAGARRSHHEHRLAVVACSREELARRLGTFLGGVADPAVAVGRTPPGATRPVFVFSGQGPQWWGMGRELQEKEAVFREALEQCDALLRGHASWSLLEELAADESRSRLSQTQFAQPALFALQVALARLWRSWGIEPAAVVGHSMGEVAAAHVAGVLSLEDAVRVVLHRGRLMQRATGHGRMAAVEISWEEAEAALAEEDGRLSIAAINGPTSTVLSGEASALGRVLRDLEERGVSCRMLPVDYAFHSPQMEGFRADLVEALAGLAPRPASVPIVSTVTGAAGTPRDFDAAYWGRNVREPVRFAVAAERLVRDGHDVFLEISPHPVLSPSLAQLEGGRGRGVTALPSLRRGGGERATMLGSLCALYCLGCAVDWSRLYPGGGRCVALPTYPWQRERHWIVTSPRRGRERDRSPGGERRPSRRHPLLGEALRSALPTFESRFSSDALTALGGGRIHGLAVFPAAACMEMALGAAAEAFGEGRHVLEHVAFREPLVLPEHAARTVQLALIPEGRGRASFKLFGGGEGEATEGAWALHATGRIVIDREGSTAGAPARVALEDIRARLAGVLSDAPRPRELEGRGLFVAAGAPAVERLWRRNGELLCEMRMPSPAGAEGYRLPPALLESCCRLASELVAGEPDEARATDPCQLTRLERLAVYGPLDGPLWSQAVVRANGASVDLRLLEDSGRVVAEVSGLRWGPVDRGAVSRATRERLGDWLYELRWRRRSRAASGQGCPRRSGRWLILADRDGVGKALAGLLERRGEGCVVVAPGQDYGSSDGCLQINPGDAGHFGRLLAEAFGAERASLRGVVYLWGIEARLPEEGRPGSGDVPDPGCGGALHLVQALVQRDGAETPRLWLVTQGAQPVATERESVQLAQAPLWGLGRVVALEHPETWGGLVDLDPRASVAANASALLAEIGLGDGEDQVAFRAGQRYVARLVRRDLPRRLGETLRLRPDAAYLIAGGLGRLGLRIARWMVERGARHLVLVGRSGATGSARASLSELEAAGARVVVERADLAKAEEVRDLLARVAGSLPPLRGVVHAAGVLDDGILLRQDRGRFARVMAPKVDGAWNLHALTRGESLDFFVLFSSMASLLGSAGQGNYAAANAFLDALAHHRRSLGLTALSIDWGPWAEAGMAAELGSRGQRSWSEQGVASIAPPQGLLVLERLLLEEGAAQVGVLAIDWSRFVRQREVGAAVLSELAQAPPAAAGVAELPRWGPEVLKRLKEALPAQRLELLEAHVQAEVAKVLGFDPERRLDPQKGFVQMGMDSLMAVLLRSRLQAGLGAPLPQTLVFNYPTIEKLAGFLAQALLPTPPEPSDAQPRKEEELAPLAAELEQRSAEELAALLDEEITSQLRLNGKASL